MRHTKGTLSGHILVEATLKLAISVSTTPAIAPSPFLLGLNCSPISSPGYDHNAINLASTVQQHWAPKLKLGSWPYAHHRGPREGGGREISRPSKRREPSDASKPSYPYGRTLTSSEIRIKVQIGLLVLWGTRLQKFLCSLIVGRVTTLLVISRFLCRNLVVGVS